MKRFLLRRTREASSKLSAATFMHDYAVWQANSRWFFTSHHDGCGVKSVFVMTPSSWKGRGMQKNLAHDQGWMWSVLGGLSLGLGLVVGDQEYCAHRVVHGLGIAGVVSANDGEAAPMYLLNAMEELANGKLIKEAGVLTTTLDTMGSGAKTKETKEKKEQRKEKDNASDAVFTTTKFTSDRGRDESRHWLPEQFDCMVALRNNVVSSRRHNHHLAGIASIKLASTVPSTSDATALASQPQCDASNRVAVVHEGQLSNARELRSQLEKSKHILWKSNSDAELLAEMVAWYTEKGFSVVDATKETLARIDGSYALALLHKDAPGQLIVAQNGSQLAVGIGKGAMYVASRPEMFGQYTDRYINLRDGEFAVVHADKSELDLSRTEKLPYTKRNVDSALATISPKPYKHWLLHEICEQPEALSRALGCGSRIAGDTVLLGGLDRNLENLLQVDHLTLVGQGSSLHAAEYAALIMADIGSFDSIHVLPANGVKKRIFSMQENAGVCVLSPSGESKSAQVAVKIAKNCHLPVFSVVNAIGSHVAKMTKMGVYVNAGEERGLLSTKVFTSQIAVLSLIAGWFAQYRNDVPLEPRLELIQALQRMPRCFSVALETQSLCAAAAKRLFDSQDCFVVGKYFGTPIAKEGARLFSTLAQVNAEGCSPGELQHGNLSLLEGPNGKTGRRTPVIVLLLDDEYATEMRVVAEQIRASGAFTLIITDNEKLAQDLADITITIPSNGMLTALNAIVPLQYLAYELGVLKGLNPDKVPDRMSRLYSNNRQ